MSVADHSRFASAQPIKWTPANAWGAVIALIGSTILINQALGATFRSNPRIAQYAQWHPYLAESALRWLRVFVWVAITYAASRVGSVPLFIRQATLHLPPTLLGWRLGWIAIGLGMLDLYAVQIGWSLPNSSASSFSQSRSAWWPFVFYLVVLSPFSEELAVRGLLYPAFRSRYRIIISILLVLSVQTYFHWGMAVHNYVGYAFVIAGFVMMCLIRERTGNLWNCILFHSLHNATVIRQWGVCLLIMVVVLLIVRSRAIEQAANTTKQTA